MSVRVVTLEQLRRSGQFGLERFAQIYTGGFLLATGLLAARESPGDASKRSARGSRTTQELDPITLEQTAAMNFGDRLTHSMNRHPLAGRAFTLGRGNMRALSVGRTSNSDLPIPERSVSGSHCTLRLDGDNLVVTDLGSTNGTWTDQERLTAHVATHLADESALAIGRYGFQFLLVPSMHRMLQLL